MRTRSLTILAILIFAGLGAGCSCTKGWQLDYGKPAAQFHAHNVASKGKPFIGKMITVKGKVLRVQDRDDGNHIYLEHNIHCLFPTWHWGEDTLKPGDEIYVDGFLERCIEADVQLNPAIRRGSKAPFTPKE